MYLYQGPSRLYWMVFGVSERVVGECWCRSPYEKDYGILGYIVGPPPFVQPPISRRDVTWGSKNGDTSTANQ